MTNCAKLVRMEIAKIILTALTVLFGLIYCYQLFFILVGTLIRTKKYPEAKINHTFAVIISARNEEKVIGNLIESIRSQDFPQENVKIFVCADNCTDKTADICRNLGATVYERFNKKQIGKGYALNFLFKEIARDFPSYEPDAFFVFDADNILSKNYFYEMNKALDAGEKVCTSYRNSKNFGTNWLSAGASIGFMRECLFLHKPKQILGLSTHISGTGFFVAKEVLTFKDGWNHVTLTEDLEFSAFNTLKGFRIAYNNQAVFYDEQPIKFKQTWTQRTRWAKGSLMGFSLFHYSLGVSFLKSLNFNYYEYYCRFFPISIYYCFSIITSYVLTILSFTLTKIDGSLGSTVYTIWPFLAPFITTYLALFADVALVTILQWNKIKAPAWKKIKYIFTTPIFNFIFTIPITIYALFKKVKWEPIEHNQVVTQQQLDN